MVTNFPHPIASRNPVTADDTQRVDDGIGGRLLDRVRQAFCGLHGHDTLLQFEHERMFLKCVSCGHESPGWELSDVPPPVRVRDDARHHALIRPQLVGARRIA